MNSSYKNTPLDYSDIFKTICFLNKPNEIVEIGVLEGFSLQTIVDSCPNANIRAFDIFENFNGNCAKRDIIDKFQKYKNVCISYGNFYELEFPEKSIDLLHVDIANDGRVYEFVFQNYIKYMKPNGIIVLEGGSFERDNVYWMTKYNKEKIQPVLDKYQKQYNIFVLKKFPALTIIKL